MINPLTAPSWAIKAHQRLQRKSDKLFGAWKATKAGQNWSQNYSRKKNKVVKSVHPTLPQNSPYAHGFSLPEYHHDLIQALKDDNEELAKGIMLEHYLDDQDTDN